MKRAILLTITCCLFTFLWAEGNPAAAQDQKDSKRPRFFQRLKEDLFGSKPKNEEPPRQPSSAKMRSAVPDEPPARILSHQWNRDRQPSAEQPPFNPRNAGATAPATVQIPPPSRGARPTNSAPQRDADWFAGLRPATAPASAIPGGATTDANRRGFGMTIQESPDGRLVVTRVDPNGNAAEAGVRPGDIVVELGGITATSAEEFTEIEKIMSPGDQLEISIRRGLADPRKIMLSWGQAAEPEIAASPIQDGPVGSGVPTHANSTPPRGNDFVPQFVPDSSPRYQPAAQSVPRRDVPAQTVSSPSRLPRTADSELLELRSIVADQQKLIRELQQELEQLRSTVRQRSSRR